MAVLMNAERFMPFHSARVAAAHGKSQRLDQGQLRYQRASNIGQDIPEVVRFSHFYTTPGD